MSVVKPPHRLSAQQKNTNGVTFAQKRDAEMRAISTPLLDFAKTVFGIGQNIRNLNGLAFHQDTSRHRSASNVKRHAFDKFAEFYRVAVARRSTETVISGAKDLSHICFAQSRCRFDERIEHG